MHALVTGGAGFIGSHLTERILRDGHSVTVLLKPGEGTDNLKELDTSKIFCDILDRQALDDACSGVDIIYHLAARTDLEGAALSDYEANIRGTENVVAATEINGVKRLVFYSRIVSCTSHRHGGVHRRDV